MDVSINYRIGLLPNAEHRGKLNCVFKQLFTCVMCGNYENYETDSIYVDKCISGKTVICCGEECQEDHYYRKRNYLRALKKQT